MQYVLTLGEVKTGSGMYMAPVHVERHTKISVFERRRREVLTVGKVNQKSGAEGGGSGWERK